MTTPIVPAMKPSASPERDVLAIVRALKRAKASLLASLNPETDSYDAGVIADVDAAIGLAAGFRRAPGWIACSERMPEDSRRCLVAVNVIGDWHSQVIAHWMANPLPGTIAMPVWQVPGGSAVLGLVTHWMPLPPAPDDNEAPHV